MAVTKQSLPCEFKRSLILKEKSIDLFGAKLQDPCPIANSLMCLHLLHFSAFSCYAVDCSESHQRPFFQVFSTIAQWVCTHQLDFNISMDCWADPFKQNLTACVMENSAMHRGVSQLLRQCFASSIRGLSGCNSRDQEFFIEFSNLVLNEQEKTFPK